VDSILRFIAQSAIWVQCPIIEFKQNIILDPGDLPFGEVAICSHSEAIVTGNVRHFLFMTDSSIKVLTPQAFVTEFQVIP
jgi:predicted nucleic acid-binding protein